LLGLYVQLPLQLSLRSLLPHHITVPAPPAIIEPPCRLAHHSSTSPPLPPAEDVVHLCTGIRPIGVFCLTLICIFYEFCLFGHIFFKDRFGISQGLDLDHVVQFDTLEDSFLTMFQARGPRLPLACPALAPRSNPLMLLSNPFVLLSTLSCCFRPVSCCFRPDACCFTSLSRSTNQNIVRYQ
jgi:hypothetical protein